MPGATMGTADAVLKEIYEKRVQELLNNDTPLVEFIDTSSEGVEKDRYTGGRYVKFALHIQRNAGIGARREDENLPPAGNQGYITGTATLANLYGSIALTNQVIAFADTDMAAFVSALDDEVDKVGTDLQVDLNRQFWNDGTGKLGVTSTVGASTTATLVTTSDAFRNFQEGMIVDVFTAAAFAANVAGTPTAPKATVTVTAINTTSGVITVSASTTFAANDVFTRTGSVAREVYGIPALVSDTGILFGINPSTQPRWASFANTNSGTPRPISEGLMNSMVNKVRTSGGKTDVIFFPLGVSGAYQNLLTQQRQIVNTTKVTGGVSSMAYTTPAGDIPLREDWTAPPGTMWGLNKKSFSLYSDGNWEWIKANSGDGMFYPLYGTNGVPLDKKGATTRRYLQLVTNKRNVNWVIKDIAEAT